MKLTLRHQKSNGIFLLPIWQQQSLIVMRQLISTDFTGRFFRLFDSRFKLFSKTISFIEIDGHGYMGSNSSNKKKTRKRKSKNAKNGKGEKRKTENGKVKNEKSDLKT